jgi:hypothetical protein
MPVPCHAGPAVVLVLLGCIVLATQAAAAQQATGELPAQSWCLQQLKPLPS